MQGTAERPRWGLFALGLALIVIGVAVAAFVQTSGGVRVEDVRFRGADGTRFSGLLYVPRNATPQTPAPGVLAVHGYINTRETQSGFAIEFARRGYVVLALDQRGHGYSGGAATQDGFGGPEGLAWLRSRPFVDPANIGLEGHSMGGWTVLAAAAQPDGYRSMVLEGSSVGPPFSQPGSPAWPRNVAVVFSTYDEFAPLMWGVPRAADVGQSKALRALFGTTAPVEAGRLYGDIAAGTARILRQPATTHPGDHLSTAAIGDAADWFARTLSGGTPRPASDQVWYWKELATGLALVGVVVLMAGAFDLLLAAPAFAALRAEPAPARRRRGGRWWAALLLGAFIPAVSFFLCVLVAPPPLPPSPIFPQSISNWLTVWALGTAVVALLLGLWLAPRGGGGPRPSLGRALLIAVAVVGLAYLACLAASLVKVDFRFWVLALKPMSERQWLAFAAYLLPFTLFLLVALQGAMSLITPSDSAARQYATAVVALTLGFVVLTGAQYAVLFATGGLPVAAEALNVIVSIQFVPLFAALAVLAVFTWRRTGSHVPGALLGGLFVTWYLVAGTATHVG